MNNQLLKDKNIFPDSENLQKLLGEIYEIYKKFQDKIEKEPFNLELNWNYYNDSKAWLCKITNKKKTILWLSAQEWLLKMTFYFTEKNEAWIKDLNISEKLKNDYFKWKMIWKLRPFMLDIDDEKCLNDIFELIKYKKSLK